LLFWTPKEEIRLTLIPKSLKNTPSKGIRDHQIRAWRSYDCKCIKQQITQQN
jgi:hypothetical protein